MLSQTSLRNSSPGIRNSCAIAGRYELGVELGRGGMGIVCAAYDNVLRREVAVKVIRRSCDDPEMLARLQREARAAAAVSHPNAVPVYDVGHDENCGAYLVMERVRGVGLHHLPLPMAPIHVVEIGSQICAALAATHERGVVHRDLKPQNLMLEPHGDTFRVRVMDFGIARFAECGDTITVAGSFIGTARYAPPEQAEGARTDARSDIYSLGVILYELLSGRLPFEATSQAAMLYMHVHRAPPRLETIAPDVPAELAALVHRCLAKMPELRPQRASDLGAALGRLSQRCDPAAPLELHASAPDDAFATTMASARGSGNAASAERELPAMRLADLGTTSSTAGVFRSEQWFESTAPRAPELRRRHIAAAIVFVAAAIVGGRLAGRGAEPAATSPSVDVRSSAIEADDPMAASSIDHGAPSYTPPLAPESPVTLAVAATAQAMAEVRDAVAAATTAAAEHEVRVVAAARPVSRANRSDVPAPLPAVEVAVVEAVVPAEESGRHDQLREEIGALHNAVIANPHSTTRHELRLMASSLSE